MGIWFCSRWIVSVSHVNHHILRRHPHFYAVCLWSNLWFLRFLRQFPHPFRHQLMSCTVYAYAQHCHQSIHFAAPHRLQRTSLEANRNSTTLVYNLAYLGSGSRISHWTVGHGITVRLRRQHVTGARSVQNAGFQSGTAAAIVATGTHRVTARNPVVVWEGGACVLLYNKWMARIRTKFYVDKTFFRVVICRFVRTGIVFQDDLLIRILKLTGNYPLHGLFFSGMYYRSGLWRSSVEDEWEKISLT